jgi:hypothetical protein
MTSWAAKLQPESQKLAGRSQAAMHERDFHGSSRLLTAARLLVRTLSARRIAQLPKKAEPLSYSLSADIS